MTEPRWSIAIDKDHIERTRIDRDEPPKLRDGEVELALQRFALTSNNVTYAVLGRSFGSFTDMPGYWAFFPTGNETDGHLPVWGFAEISASHCDALPQGERVYGFFPLASHVVMQPARISQASFVDGSSHRADLAPVYNEYLRLSGIPDFREDESDLWPVFRPLLTTGFLIADQFAEEDHYGAEQVIMGSASSKTALLTAQCFRSLQTRPRLIGLTSSKNEAFVRETGLYEDVVPYDALETIPGDVPTAFVDMAGNGRVIERVHERFAAHLKLSLMVGLSHWDAGRVRKRLPGPSMTPFFAPGRLKKRANDWGRAGFQGRLREAWSAFTERASSLTEVQVKRGAEEAQRAYLAALRGEIDPRLSLIIELL